MRLETFVKKHTCPNTLIRLWKPCTGEEYDHICLEYNKETSGVCMNWALLKGTVAHSKYKDCDVVGVNDILTEMYPEAVNIVINTED